MILVSKYKNFRDLAIHHLVPLGLPLGLLKEAPCLSHVTIKDVVDQYVVGTLPLFLASRAKIVLEIPINLPAGFRTQEVSLKLLIQYSKFPTLYTVNKGNPNNKAEWLASFTQR